MIKQLHPTLKKCKCGFIGQRNSLYKHFDYHSRKISQEVLGENLDATERNKRFFAKHGEVPYNIEDTNLI